MTGDPEHPFDRIRALARAASPDSADLRRGVVVYLDDAEWQMLEDRIREIYGNSPGLAAELPEVLPPEAQLFGITVRKRSAFDGARQRHINALHWIANRSAVAPGSVTRLDPDSLVRAFRDIQETAQKALKGDTQ